MSETASGAAAPKATASADTATVSAPAPAPAPAIRHDWYQTDERVVITVLLRNANAAQVSVDIQPQRVLMTATNPAIGLDYTLDLQLLHAIDAQSSTHHVGTVKVEIKLAKVVGERWAALERTADPATLAGPQKVVNIYKQDWEKLEKHVENNEDEYRTGDALNGLFQKIYQGASEETRRAMNKSFSESGGTVLSTNWNEIGSQKVEVKPPDGTEFKQWES